jgi:hypothetical protein
MDVAENGGYPNFIAIYTNGKKHNPFNLGLIFTETHICLFHDDTAFGLSPSAMNFPGVT